MPQKADHEIKINLVDDRHAKPTPQSNAMNKGETVRYHSPNGKIRVEFEPRPSNPTKSPSPFGNDVKEINDSELHTVTTEGTFDCHCFIILKDGTERGWKKGSKESGGEHQIPRPPVP